MHFIHVLELIKHKKYEEAWEWFYKNQGKYEYKELNRAAKACLTSEDRVAWNVYVMQRSKA